uniref:Uncharacterized protein n=1 Tax=Cacopsylla melanoneura TaxID=428564 RepID=A0A8D8QQ23_9HEMI
MLVMVIFDPIQPCLQEIQSNPTRNTGSCSSLVLINSALVAGGSLTGSCSSLPTTQTNCTTLRVHELPDPIIFLWLTIICRFLINIMRTTETTHSWCTIVYCGLQSHC